MGFDIENFRTMRAEAIAQLSEQEKRHAVVTMVQNALLSYQRIRFIEHFLDKQNKILPEVLSEYTDEQIDYLFGKNKAELPGFFRMHYIQQDDNGLHRKTYNIRREISTASFCLGMAKNIYASMESMDGDLFGELTEIRRKAEWEKDNLHGASVFDCIETAYLAEKMLKPLLDKMVEALGVAPNENGRDLMLGETRAAGVRETIAAAAKCGDKKTGLSGGGTPGDATDTGVARTRVRSAVHQALMGSASHLPIPAGAGH